MCGIAGCIGTEAALPFLINGLKKLEYRGYDSAGSPFMITAILSFGGKSGKISELEKELIAGETINGTWNCLYALGDHGAPFECNSTSPPNDDGHFAVVHNGIIENYLDLKKNSWKRDTSFPLETPDTEVLPNLWPIVTKVICSRLYGESGKNA